jgi:N-acetylglucosamine-6-phosphate deacetylase
VDNFKVSPVTAVTYFSTNPAKAYNLENVGSIEVGKLANFVIVNNQNEVVSVVYKGEVVSPA